MSLDISQELGIKIHLQAILSIALDIKNTFFHMTPCKTEIFAKKNKNVWIS